MNIFIDTQDMEERYGEELYKEYLENENNQLKDRIEKAFQLLQTFHHYFPDYDDTHKKIEDIEIILKGEENNNLQN